MKFESTYEDCVEARLTQSEAAAIFGQSDLTHSDMRKLAEMDIKMILNFVDLKATTINVKVLKMGITEFSSVCKPRHN